MARGQGRLQRGPDLPYKLLAGVVPYSRGWLVAPGKLIGITVYADDPYVAKTFAEVVEHVPAYVVVAVDAPVGLVERPHRGGRAADREARHLLGFTRGGAIGSAPCTRALDALDDYDKAVRLNGGQLDIVTWQLLPRIAEINEYMMPYMQRQVYEVRPDLTYYQLNNEHPVKHAKDSRAGQRERRELLRSRVQGSDRIFNARLPRVRRSQLMDATAALWTARRIFARSVNRIPEQPEWNEMGLRMEIVR